MSKTAKIVFALYLLLSLVCAIGPYDRAVWWAENIPIWIVVGIIAWLSKSYQFSPLSYVMFAIFPMLHTVGGHFTFERVPFDWVTELFDFERNHYDRIAHYSVGFYAYPFAEYLKRKSKINATWVVYALPLFFIMALAAFYEIVEWQYAISADAEAGIAVLGSQGDIWDAQKDMLADTLGAITALALYSLFGRGRTVQD